MQPFQQRVVTEANELDERLEKLKAFLQSHKLEDVPEPERTLVREQLVRMQSIFGVLIQRIEAFKS